MKLSQQALADILKVSRVSVVNIEAGRQHTPVHMLWCIAEHLGTDLPLLIPRPGELRPELEPVKLDAATVAQIEEVANGNLESQQQLRSLISNMKAQLGKQNND